MDVALLFAHGGGSGGGSALASFGPVWMFVGGFAAVVAALTISGRPDPAWGRLRVLARAPERLHRLTGLPGWAATAIGLALFGLVLAGQGFYSDVAWHIAFGRDDDLFTAPHTAILAGLVCLVAGAALGTVVATLDRVPGTVPVFGASSRLRVPRALLPLWALGLGALAGFPADDLWHAAYGIDVTMWSPTHLLMILGASFTGIAAWVVLGATGMRPTTSRWGRGLHVACAWLTLEGLVAPLGEYTFGVPQFSALYAPVLVCIAAGFAVVSMRLVLGSRWALGLTVVAFAFMASGRDRELPIPTRFVGTFVVSAVFVELAAHVLGTERRGRLALVSGVGIGTLGLASEWVWNQSGPQPWTGALLPGAVVLGTIGAVGSAVLAARLAPSLGAAAVATSAASAASATTVPSGIAGRTAAAGLAACILVLVVPLGRGAGQVTATTHLEPDGRGHASVDVTLEPVDAADGAYWFQATSWQGGGLVVTDLRPTGTPGRYRSDATVPIDGRWKTLVRLHRAGEMMAVPIFLPADPAIGAPEIPAIDRQAPFEIERTYLLRETHDGNAWLAPLVHGFFVAVLASWVWAFTAATGTRSGVTRRAVEPDGRPRRPRAGALATG